MDWANEKVEWLFDDKKRGDGCPHGLLGTACRDCIAQALRDVQRETAEECCAIVAPPTDSGKYFSRAMQGKVRAIRERFGLKVRL